MIRFRIVSIPVEDQAKALAFYHGKMGFTVKHDIDMGGPRWLTLVSPDDPDGTELLLEPNGDYPAMKAFKQSLQKDGIPVTQFDVKDIDAEYARLTANGVSFKGPPETHGNVRMATLDDENGNAILLIEQLD